MIHERFIFLGTGGSMGIPVIACDCSVCRSDNPKNKRTRSAGLLTVDDKNILIDCGPDFRQQALKYCIDHLDGVILTHAHHDHTGGIDELRAYYIKTRTPLPCLLSKETSEEVHQRFPYIFREGKYQFTSKLSLQLLESERGSVEFAGIHFRYLSYEQMGMRVNGFRWKDFAYISDIKLYPESIFEDLKGVQHLVLSALRFTPSDFHFTVDEAVEFAEKVGAKNTWLTHIAHELEHEKTNAYLPSNIQMAYDGLELNLMEML